MAIELDHEAVTLSRYLRRDTHDALCRCGHGRSVHGAEGTGTRECHACRSACAAGAPCPTAGNCCAFFVEVGRVA